MKPYRHKILSGSPRDKHGPTPKQDKRQDPFWRAARRFQFTYGRRRGGVDWKRYFRTPLEKERIRQEKAARAGAFPQRGFLSRVFGRKAR